MLITAWILRFVHTSCQKGSVRNVQLIMTEELDMASNFWVKREKQQLQNTEELQWTRNSLICAKTPVTYMFAIEEFKGHTPGTYPQGYF